MRLRPILPSVAPTVITLRPARPFEDCEGRHFEFHQEVSKTIRDTVYDQVVVHRYKCLRCKRTTRVYPQGVTRTQTSQRVQGLAVLLYLLGLSYGAASLTLEALGVYVCKSQAYEIVQAAAERVSGLKRGEVFEKARTPALGGDITSVRCNGQWLPLGPTVDATTGLVLSVDQLSGEDAETLREWMGPNAEAVGAKLLVSDGADGFKIVANELGLEHQVCKSHITRNTGALIENLLQATEADADGSLTFIGVASEQATGVGGNALPLSGCCTSQ